jgi:hypothetical protein
MFERTNCLLSGIVAAACLAGCSHSVPNGAIVKTVPAKGKLTYHGRPLAYYQVTVLPKDDRPAVGITDEDGAFVLGTNDTGDGAVVGTHRVTVVYVGPPSKNPEEDVPPPPKVKIDRKFSKAETSGLTVEIPADGTSDLRIDLK